MVSLLVEFGHSNELIVPFKFYTTWRARLIWSINRKSNIKYILLFLAQGSP